MADAGTARRESPIAGSVVHAPVHIPTGTPLGGQRSAHSGKRDDQSQQAAGQADDLAQSKDREECLELGAERRVMYIFVSAGRVFILTPSRFETKALG